MLGEEGQDFFLMEALEVIHEDARLAQPLAVELAPHALGPAGIGDGEVQSVRIDLVPVAGRDEVAQGILVVMGSDLGIAGGAGSEEHQHQVIAAGAILRPVVMGGVGQVLLIEAAPALTLAIDHDLVFHRGAVQSGRFGLGGHVTVRRADDGANARCLKAVGNVLLQQLVGGQDDHRAQLVQGIDDVPELVMPLEDEHHLVAPLDADGAEVVAGLVGLALDILEGDAALGAVLRHMHESSFVRILVGNGVHHVEGEVEVLGILVGQAQQRAGLVLHGGDVILPDALLAVLLPLGSDGRRQLGAGVGDIIRRIEDDGVELAVLAAHRQQTVGRVGVVVDRVAGAEDLIMGTDLHLQVALEHQVELLALVGRQGDLLPLGSLIVFGLDVQRLGDTVLVGRGHVVVGHAVGLLDALTVACTGQVVGGQRRAGALDQVGHVNAQHLRAAVQEREVQIALAALTGQVIRHGHAGLQRHLRRCEALDLAQLLYSVGHFHDRQIKAGDHFFHLFLPGDAKTRPKENCSLRRALYPRYHSNYAISCVPHAL